MDLTPDHTEVNLNSASTKTKVRYLVMNSSHHAPSNKPWMTYGEENLEEAKEALDRLNAKPADSEMTGSFYLVKETTTVTRERL